MTKKIAVYPGDKYSQLTIVRERDTISGRRMFECVCDCGTTVVVRLENLRGNITKSCGCYQKEMASKATLKHGYSCHPLYSVWEGMKTRCYNTAHEDFYLYGERGIRVCDEWLNDPIRFIAWSLANGWKPGLTIDRKNNDGNYEPGNCRFVTVLIQARNKRTNYMVTYQGETKCLSEWAPITGIPYKTLWARIKAEWEIERAFTLPVRPLAVTYGTEGDT
jgi:hypothetical protein